MVIENFTKHNLAYYCNHPDWEITAIGKTEVLGTLRDLKQAKCVKCGYSSRFWTAPKKRRKKRERKKNQSV